MGSRPSSISSSIFCLALSVNSSPQISDKTYMIEQLLSQPLKVFTLMMLIVLCLLLLLLFQHKNYNTDTQQIQDYMQYFKMQPDTFQIAINQEEVQYYELIRQLMQMKQIGYWIGNPSVEIINGTIELVDSEAVPDSESYQEYIQCLVKQNEEKKQKRQKMLALVGIPNNKTPIEIHESLERFHPRTVQTKVIKTTASKYYAMLLLFEDESSSTQFYDAAFGQEYNGIEMERIILREMGDMTVTFTGLSKDSTPEVLSLRFLPKEGETINAEQIFRKSLTPPETKKQASNTSNPSHNTCAICFEEITNAIITILCGHSFHWECLGNWNQNTCPLCRYYQHPPIIKFCQQCNQCEGLWVCLICGIRLCCGSQNNILGHDSHIYQHYQQTSHSLSMELETKFLFDARQPAFLHQMFYKELMGDSNQMYQQGKCKSKTDKLKEKISEYGQDVSEQMQRQRKFFQDVISKSIKQNRQKLTKKKNTIENLSNEVQAINMRIQQAKKHNEDLMSEGLTLEKEYDMVKKVQNKIQQKQKCLKVERQKEQKEIDYYDQLIQEKREELRDIRKNVKLKEKLQENLDGQQVGFQFILGMGEKKKKKK